jgi:hypothetical protein
MGMRRGDGKKVSATLKMVTAVFAETSESLKLRIPEN